MSINNIQATTGALEAARQAVTSYQNVANVNPAASFGNLLVARINALTNSGTSGASASNTSALSASATNSYSVDVSAATAAARSATQIRANSAGSLNPATGTLNLTSENIVDVAQATLQRATMLAGANWTGQVDTSDGMLEKAAPYMSIINEASSVFGIPSNVIMAVIKAESDYEQYCISPSGAKGLMQIMPCNEEYYGVTDSYDPRQNIFCGVHEISDLLSKYNGDLRLALAAYNTGSTRIARLGVTSSSDAAYQSVPQAVREYADRVLRYAGLAS